MGAETGMPRKHRGGFLVFEDSSLWSRPSEIVLCLSTPRQLSGTAARPELFWEAGCLLGYNPDLFIIFIYLSVCLLNTVASLLFMCLNPVCQLGFSGTMNVCGNNSCSPWDRTTFLRCLFINLLTASRTSVKVYSKLCA